MLEQSWEILRNYFENQGNVVERVWKLRTDFGRSDAPSAPYVRYLAKKVNETGILIDKPKLEKLKTVSTPKNIAAYRVQLVQELNPIDHQMRYRFAKWTCDRRTEDANFGKKKNHLLRWSSLWSWRVCKQAELSHLGHRKPARIHWKAGAPKTNHYLVRILVQKMSKERPLQSMTIVFGPCWKNFCSQKLKTSILATFGFNRTALRASHSYTRCFAACF